MIGWRHTTTVLGYNIFYYYYLLANLINKALFSFVHFSPFRGTYKYCILEPNRYKSVPFEKVPPQRQLLYLCFWEWESKPKTPNKQLCILSSLHLLHLQVDLKTAALICGDAFRGFSSRRPRDLCFALNWLVSLRSHLLTFMLLWRDAVGFI